METISSRNYVEQEDLFSRWPNNYRLQGQRRVILYQIEKCYMHVQNVCTKVWMVVNNRGFSCIVLAS